MSTVNPTEVAKLEAAKRSLAISQRAVSTALDAAKRRKKKTPAAGGATRKKSRKSGKRSKKSK